MKGSTDVHQHSSWLVEELQVELGEEDFVPDHLE
jgi:hypothetical protein